MVNKEKKFGFTEADLKEKIAKKKWEWLQKAAASQESNAKMLSQWSNRNDRAVSFKQMLKETSHKLKENKQMETLIRDKVIEDQVVWDEWFKNQDTYIDPKEWSFQRIDLKEGLSEQEMDYIQKLHDLTIPVPSIIFKRDPCLIWTKAKNPDGYAKHNPPKNLKGSTLVHRWLWECGIGELGEATIDHACGKTSCINLRHLRPLDRNLNRKYGDHRNLDINQYNA